MSITFECECGRRLKAGDDKAGRAIRCPACGATIKVPQPESAAAVLPAEEPVSNNSHHHDEEEVPADNISSELASAPSIDDDTDAQVGVLPPRVRATPPPLGESVKPSVVSPPSGAGSDTKRATGGVTAMQGYIIIAILLIGLGAPIFGVLKPTPKWEYKVEKVTGLYEFAELYEINQKIEPFGKDGWELVTATRLQGRRVEYEMVFKRRKYLVWY